MCWQTYWDTHAHTDAFVFLDPVFKGKELNLEKGKKCFSSFKVLFLLGNSSPDSVSQPTSVIWVHDLPPLAPLRGAAGPRLSEEGAESSGKLSQSCLWRRANKSWSSRDYKFEYIKKLSDRRMREKGVKIIKFKENQDENNKKKSVLFKDKKTN